MADAITALPAAPSRQSPSDFSPKADALLGALATLVTEINAVAAALNLISVEATSTTSLTIGTGSQSLTVDTGKSFLPGQSVKIARTSSPSNWMHGDVTSYNSGTGALVVNVTNTLGSGTYTDWTITLSAPGMSFATAAKIIAGIEPDEAIAPDQLAIALFHTKGAIPYASDVNTPASLAAGAANLKMFMNAGATAPEWAVGIKILSITRDLTASGGDVAYTGVGFKPSALIAISGSSSYGISVGFADAETPGVGILSYSGGYTTGVWLINSSSGAATAAAICKTTDADGFTLTWTKSGSPTGTLPAHIICLR
ncbi:MAG: hypothetical protein ABFD50_00305 [Smithella sp.]